MLPPPSFTRRRRICICTVWLILVRCPRYLLRTSNRGPGGEVAVDLALTAIGLAITALVAFVAYRQQRPSQRLAERQLQELMPLKVILNDSEADEIVWVLPWGKKKIKYFADFEVSLINPNDKTVHDVFVIVEMSNLLYPADFPRRGDNATKLHKIEAVADPISGKELTRVTYRIDSIHPHVQISLRDFIILGSSSIVKNSVPVTFKDGVSARVKYSFDFGYHVKISVMGQDIDATCREIGILSYDLKDDIVQGLFKSEATLASLSANIGTARAAQSAWLLVVKKPAPAPPWVPTEYKRRFGVARLSDAERYKGSRFPDIGYLPVRVTHS